MRILFNSRQDAIIKPVLIVLLTSLFFSPVAGKAQGVYTTAGQAREMGITNIVGQLEYNALIALLGAVVLMGIIFIGHVSKACADLDRPRVNDRRPLFSLLILVAELSAICSSCSVEQQAMAERYRDAAAAKNDPCPFSNRHEYYANIPYNNGFPSNRYSNAHSPSICKYCGQRVSNSRK